uniref:Uncharacterized protein n=2 Tax=Clastoptera arizonana TaxID=38151 RepID=A0A1B6CFA1_9HEMI
MTMYTSWFLLAATVVLFSNCDHTVHEIWKLVGDYRAIVDRALNLSECLTYQYAVHEKLKKLPYEKYKNRTEIFLKKVRPILKRLEMNNVNKTGKYYLAIKDIIGGMENLYKIKKDDYEEALTRLNKVRKRFREVITIFEEDLVFP